MFLSSLVRRDVRVYGYRLSIADCCRCVVCYTVVEVVVVLFLALWFNGQEISKLYLVGPWPLYIKFSFSTNVYRFQRNELKAISPMHIHSFLINAANYEFWLLIDGLFPILILVHLLVAPYSKVEEAFNLEAIHDILRYGLSRDAIEHHYDHVAFPGPVPRTFLGAFALAGLSKPCTSWLNNSLDVQILGIYIYTLPSL